MLVTQLCPTLCDPMNYSLPVSSISGILQARILEWVAIPFAENLSDPQIEPQSPALRADSLPSESQEKPICTIYIFILCVCMCVYILDSNSVSDNSLSFNLL